jgi:hypothetical protein
MSNFKTKKHEKKKNIFSNNYAIKYNVEFSAFLKKGEQHKDTKLYAIKCRSFGSK